MNKQISLSNLEDELSQVRTKKKEFLEQIERIVPWNEWAAMIKPCYYKGERGNMPYDLKLIALHIFARMRFLEATFRQANFLWKNSLRCGIIHL